MSFRVHTVRLAASWFAAGLLGAQPTAAAPTAQGGAPAQSGAASAPTAAKPLSYRSPFEGYRRFTDQPVMPWREANDLVGHIGGWQAYARESQGAVAAETDSAAASPSASSPARAAPASSPSSPASAPGGHSGHHAP